MKTLRFAVMIVLLFVAIGASNNIQDKPGKDFFSVLSEGQFVTVKEVAGKYEIKVVDDIPLGSKVVEIGSDYVVLEDAAGVIETRIHVTSIKCVTRLKLPKE